MAAVRATDDLATPLLQLCSLWRLSTKSNVITATMKRMRAPRAPSERFARGKGATKTWAEHSKQLDADPLEPVSRTRSSFQPAFARPTPAYEAPPARTKTKTKNPTNSIRLTISKVSRRIPSNKSGSEIDFFLSSQSDYLRIGFRPFILQDFFRFKNGPFCPFCL